MLHLGLWCLSTRLHTLHSAQCLCEGLTHSHLSAYPGCNRQNLVYSSPRTGLGYRRGRELHDQNKPDHRRHSDQDPSQCPHNGRHTESARPDNPARVWGSPLFLACCLAPSGWTLFLALLPPCFAQKDSLRFSFQPKQRQVSLSRTQPKANQYSKADQNGHEFAWMH